MKMVLRCDVAGFPVRWITPQNAVRLYALERVAWEFGDVVSRFHGGTNALTGNRSLIEVRPIISAFGGLCESQLRTFTAPLGNFELFRRDRQICLYCGNPFPLHKLTRDHIVPLSKGGADVWGNCVTACKRCNNHKADSTLNECGMRLLAVPYVPNFAEFLILSNRHIIADQMEFLAARVSADSRMKRL